MFFSRFCAIKLNLHRQLLFYLTMKVNFRYTLKNGNTVTSVGKEFGNHLATKS